MFVGVISTQSSITNTNVTLANIVAHGNLGTYSDFKAQVQAVEASAALMSSGFCRFTPLLGWQLKDQEALSLWKSVHHTLSSAPR